MYTDMFSKRGLWIISTVWLISFFWCEIVLTVNSLMVHSYNNIRGVYKRYPKIRGVDNWQEL